MKFDARTRKWFEQHPQSATTIARCAICGLAYKPSLGHKCKQTATQNKEDKDND